MQIGEGWERLCEFLEKEVPNVEYPRSDAWAGWKMEEQP